MAHFVRHASRGSVALVATRQDHVRSFSKSLEQQPDQLLDAQHGKNAEEFGTPNLRGLRRTQRMR